MLYMAVWTLFAALLAGQAYFRPLIDPSQALRSAPANGGNVHHSFGYDFLVELEVWYTRAVVAPAAVWLALHYRFQAKKRFTAICLHLVAGIILDFIALQGMANLRHWFASDHPGFGLALRQSTSMHFVPNLLGYWMLVGLVNLWHYYNAARREELRSARLQGELANTRLTVLKSQLHPHFLFNALHSINSLLHEDLDVAEDLLLRLSQLLRAMLDDTHAQEISLRREMLFLDWHLGIERIRYGDRLTTRIEIEEGLHGCAVPHLILQTLVENAIRHGIGKHPGKDEISIQARRVDNLLQLEVTNSNSVFVAAKPAAFGHGVGLANIKSRLQELYDGESSFSIVNLVPRGVSVTVNLPFRCVADDAAAITSEYR